MFALFRQSAAGELLKHRCATYEHSGIPRLLHQTWSDANQLPEEIRLSIERLRKLNPEWSYKLYTDSDVETLIGECYGPAILAAYRSICPSYGAARADLFRYLCIYHHGGVYLDIKSTVDRPLAEIIRPDDQYLLAQWDQTPESPHRGWGVHPALAGIPNGEYQQWHVIASPGHPFLRRAILKVLSNLQHYWPRRKTTGQKGVLAMTGPIAYTLAIQPILNQHAHRFLPPNSGLRYSIFEALGRHHKDCFPTHYSNMNTPVVCPRGLRRLASAYLSWRNLRRAQRRQSRQRNLSPS